MHRKEAEMVHTPCLWENTKAGRPCFAQGKWKNMADSKPKGKGKGIPSRRLRERLTGKDVQSSEAQVGGKEGKGGADKIFFLLETW